MKAILAPIRFATEMLGSGGSSRSTRATPGRLRVETLESRDVPTYVPVDYDQFVRVRLDVAETQSQIIVPDTHVRVTSERNGALVLDTYTDGNGTVDEVFYDPYGSSGYDSQWVYDYDLGEYVEQQTPDSDYTERYRVTLSKSGYATTVYTTDVSFYTYPFLVSADLNIRHTAPPPPTPPPQYTPTQIGLPVRIDLTLRETNTGLPVDGATVRVSDSSRGDVYLQTISSAAGRVDTTIFNPHDSVGYTSYYSWTWDPIADDWDLQEATLPDHRYTQYYTVRLTKPDFTTVQQVETANLNMSPFLVRDTYTLLNTNPGAPTLDAIPNQTVVATHTLTFDANATGPAGYKINYSMVGAPAGAVMNSANGVFRWTPLAFQTPGVFPVTVTARLEGVGIPNAFTTQSFLLTVNEAPGPMTVNLPFVDDFGQGADTLSRPWLTHQGFFGTTTVATGVAGTVSIASVNGVSEADTVAEVTASWAQGVAGLFARYSGTGDRNMYLLQARNGQLEILKNVNGTWTILTSRALPATSGRLAFSVVGDTLSGFFNGTLWVQAMDRSIAAPGRIGLRAGGAATFDDYSSQAGFPPAPVSFPFTAAFTGTSGGILGIPSWRTNVGRFVLQGDRAVAPATVAVASLYGANAANETAVAHVDFSVAGSSGGVFVRYGGNGDRDMYFAAATRTQLSIWKNVAGVWTKLASAPLPPNVKSGELRLTAVGTTLSLYFDGTLRVQALDRSLSSGGVGIRAVRGFRFADFSADTAVPSVATLPFTMAQNGPGVFHAIGGRFVIGPAGGIVAPVGGLSVATIPSVTAGDVVVGATLDWSAGNAGLFARMNGPGINGYMVQGVGTVLKLFKNVDGKWTVLGQVNVGTNRGHVELHAIGDELRVYFNRTLKIRRNDDTFASGGIALRGAGASWSGLTIREAVDRQDVATPYTSDFGSGVAESPIAEPHWTQTINSRWIHRGGRAVALGTGASIALLNTGVSADETITARVDVTATNSVAGVVLRYSGAGDRNMYLAQLRRGMLELWKNVEGRWTKLASTRVDATTTIADLKFAAIGTTLAVYLDDTLRLQVLDRTFASGLSGMRGAALAGIASVALEAPTPPAVTLPFLSAPSVPGQWNAITGGFVIRPDHVIVGRSDVGSLALLRDLDLTDVVMGADVAWGPGRSAGLAVRANAATGDRYFVQGAGTRVTLYKSVGGVVTTLAAKNVTRTSGRLEILAVGDALTVFYGGLQILSVTDGDLLSGTAGVQGRGGSFGLVAVDAP